MADLVLNWGLLGAFGTNVEPTQTVDTGGVNVTIGFEAQDEEASGITFNAPGYVAEDDPFDSQSFLKLSGQGGEGGVDATSTTTLDFTSSNALFEDCVQNVTFRLNDLDGGGNDIDPTTALHEDIVTIRAYGPDGNELPVTFTTGSNVTATGNTLSDGDTNFGYEDGEASTLVSVAGPVTRIEIEYANGNVGEQTVMVSDLHFSTCPADDNDAPVVVDDSAMTDEDTAVVVDVLGNDSDPEGDPLTVTDTSEPGNGSVVINGDGTVTYTPDMGFIGTDTFDYTVSDGQGNLSTATVTVTVSDPMPNEPAMLVDDAAETDEDTAVVIDVLGNDSDPEGDALTVTDTTEPANGSVVINADGTVTYTPDAGFTGEDTFEYSVEDEGGNISTATVTVTVGDTGPNNPATPVDDMAETDENTAVVIDVLGNDSDPEGDVLTVVDTSEPANGSVVVNADGTVTYTPDAGFTGTDTFEYTVEDEGGNFSSAVVVVQVGDPDLPPVATDDAETTEEDTAVVIDVLGNDSDPEGEALTVTDTTEPANGSVVINADGTVTYTPDAGFTGTDTFDYTITDPAGNESTATVTVVVEADPDLPPVATDDANSTDVGTPVVIAVLSNDSDPEGEALTVSGTTEPANGSVVINADGTVTYTPDAGFIGTDTFDYTVSDPAGNESTATVTVVVSDPVVRDGIVSGTGGDDLIDTAYTGDPDGDMIDANDQIIPGEDVNDDIVRAGDGDDTVLAGDGDDDVQGGTGDDYISGEAGNDELFGEDGNDIIDGGDGDDTIDGGNGRDSVGGGNGNDVIDTSGPDPLIDVEVFPGLPVDADPENDRDNVSGGAGDDIIRTGDDRDTITGGTGDDTIFAGIDDDEVFGNEGNDSIVDIQGSDFIVGGDGDDTIEAGTNTFSDYIGDDPNLPVAGFPGIVTDPNTTDGLDTVFGGAGNDVISTGDDADEIDGGTGNDTIDGGIDDDTIVGGEGDDSIIGQHGADSIFGNDGDDFINAGGSTYGGNEIDATDILPENDRDFADGGAGNDTIFGEDDDDTLIGGDGDDFLDGGIDEDSLTGGNGSDTGIGGQGDDFIDLSGFMEEPDSTDPNPENDRDLAEGGDGDDTIITGDDDDTIFGGAGNDVIDAGIDEDSVFGGDGSDTIDGGEGDDFIDASGTTEELDATDPDPEDDRDSVIGGAGNDTILTGDDRDTIDSGDGDDSVDAGIDDDIVTTGAGSDTVDAGQGDDLIDTSGPDFDNAPDSEDLDPENDRDSVIAGAGNDTITTGDDRDTIDAGAGNDLVDAGIDDDSVIGGDGSDTIDGGDGNDVIDSSGGTPLTDDVDPDPEDDRDSIIGGNGDDTITTGDDADTIFGGTGNDVIDAGIDNDLVDGGAGNDVIDGGEGADTLLGGDGQDTFINITAGDVVDGGDGQPGTAPDGRPFDFDTLDLTGAAEANNPGGSLNITYTSDDREDGFVEFRDADGNVTSTMNFEEIENVVPCFTPGTAIATPRGERLVEDLKVGDKIITRDNGIQEIRWMGQKTLSGHELARSPNLRPILIQKGSLGNNLPEHDILVSPQHRILINNERTSLYFEETEVLAAAKHLTSLKGVDEVGTLGVTYVHFMFDNHEVVLSNGAWTESFQPGQSVIDGLGTEQRDEIFQLFPELKTEEGIKDYTAARRALKKHEAKLLVR